MYRLAARRVAFAPPAQVRLATHGTRRWASTTPANKPRSARSSLARWGIAIAAVYYYNTSKVFAEEPAYAVAIPETDKESEILPTVDEVVAQRRKQKSLVEPQPANADATSATAVAGPGEGVATPGAGQLEEEAESEGAFNPETGEINWDCPCLGGMAHGPCGEEFKTAFSCFVFSNEEPKGMDCIDKFKGMQTCFRAHPEVYGAEFDEEEEDQPLDGEPGSAIGDSDPPQKHQPASSESDGSLATLTSTPNASEKVADTLPPTQSSTDDDIANKRERSRAATEQVRLEHHPQSETEDLVPKAWHDTTDAGPEKK